MITVLSAEITNMYGHSMAKVTVQFPITDIPTDEAGIIKAVKDALTKAEQAAPVASAPKPSTSNGTPGAPWRSITPTTSGCWNW